MPANDSNPKGPNAVTATTTTSLAEPPVRRRQSDHIDLSQTRHPDIADACAAA
ncbi:hypothetical protein GCM10022226_80790 [Sphaerisporangium flaviroseum]|uniref:Uncharacterized protein n=1 Tax=Sphaerisporangium flaviroseum TaxID=509199 RepID=A0ABP7JJ64_9ACTN